MKIATYIIISFIFVFNIYAERGVNLIALGDWGVKGTAKQKDVASAMSHYALNNRINFIVTCGDNFYSSGVTSVNDEHWTKSWSDVYNLPGLKRLNWYVSLGNHDYQGSVPAELEFAKINKRWKLPARYYVRRFEQSGVTADFFFIDTSPFITSYYSNPAMSSLLEVRDQTEVQKNWLKKALRRSKADWQIIVGHHPFFSSTPSREPERVEMRDNFYNIFKNNGADIYLAGHDHDLQLSKDPALPTYQVISGGGYGSRAITEQPFHIFAAASPGFAALKLKKNRFMIEFVDDQKKSLFKQSYRRK